MKNGALSRITVLILLGAMCFPACRQGTAEKSTLFYEICGTDPVVFRGMRLGMPIDLVGMRETLPLRHRDGLGLQFQAEAEGGTRINLEYYAGQKGTVAEGQLVSIVCNVFLREEVRATQLYGELEGWLRERGGVPEGKFGDWEWQHVAWESGSAEAAEEWPMDISLRFSAGKTGITLNFYRSEIIK